MKLLIDNFKQLADSIGKSNTTVPLLQTTDFSENINFILPKKYTHRKSYEKSREIKTNKYIVTKSLLIIVNIQNSDALRLSGNENKLNRNRNVLDSQNTGNKRGSVVTNTYPER